MTGPAAPRARATFDQPIVEVDAAVPLLHVSVAVKAGSLLDPVGKEGTARLLLRLMRRSGDGLSADHAEETIDRLGGHLGGDVNRSTSAFHGGAIARSTERFLDFIEATICRPRFGRAELSQLLDETRAELIERLDDDRSLARSFWVKKVFAGHAYARPTSGTLASITRIGLVDIEELYPKLFTRGAARFAFAGQITREQAQQAAARIADGLGRDVPVTADPADAQGPVGRQLVFVDKPDRTQTQIVIGGMGTLPSDEDHTALHVGNTIFGGTFTARLTQEVRAKRGWSYGAYSSIPFDRRRQTFSMWTFPQASDAAACIRLELELLDRWVERGVTARELAAAKKYLLRSHAFSVDTASKRAGLGLDEELYDLPVGHQSRYLARVQGVSLEQVNAAIGRRISSKNLVVTVLGTHKDIGSAVRESIADLASDEVVPFNQSE